MPVLVLLRCKSAALAGSLILAGATVCTGCDDDKEVLDVETPAGEVEVDQDEDTGEIDVDATENE